MDLFNHEEFQKRYQDEKKSLIEKTNERKKEISRTMKFIIVVMIIELASTIFGFLYNVFILSVISIYIFIAGAILLYGCKRQIDKCNNEYRLGLSKIVDRLEKENLYDYPGQDEITIIITKNIKKNKKIKIIIIVVLILAYSIGLGVHFLCTFNPDDWQTKPWKRKYMINDLMKQQDWEAIGNSACPYNVKFMTKEQMDKLFLVPEKNDVAVDIDIQVIHEFEIYYAYTDKDGTNVWIVAYQTYVGEWYIRCCKSGYFAIDTYY